MKKIVKVSTKKADEGCNIDFTFIRFFKDDKNYIDLPLDVFTSKKNMSLTRRNTKIWNRANIKRLITNNPKIREFDDEMLKETIQRYFKTYLKENN